MLLHASAPEQARAAQIRALSATARANSPVTEALSAGRHMQFSWLTRSRPEAIRDSLAAIDAIETLRSLQDAADSSAELFSAWTLDYYWLSGRLLQDPREGDLEIAFSITERLRARALLDVRERCAHAARSRQSGGRRAPSAAPGASPRIQRKLMDPTLDDTRTTRRVSNGSKRWSNGNRKPSGRSRWRPGAAADGPTVRQPRRRAVGAGRR